MPAVEPPPPGPIAFDGWTLNPAGRTLTVHGEPVRLGDRAFDLLCVLAAHPGQLLRKDELLDRVWPGRVVEENNLSVQITALRKALGAALIQNVSGVGYRLAAWPLAEATPQASAAVPAAADGPPTLLGRDDELAQLRTRVAQAPLTSIVGPGGVGKTTLARALLRAVEGAGEAPADGLHWIDLAPLRPGTPLLPLVAQALGLVSPVEAAPEDTLRALASREALLVLDNCEHLADDVAALLAPLLQRAPRLRWLATSQEALRLAGEQVFRLGPLTVPGVDASPAECHASAALALFCRRAEAGGAAANWTAESLAQVAELCRRLDGLPLALEIAAARVATLGLAGVAQQLHQRPRLRSTQRGAPSRQHSLLQTYAWSYGLLAPLEQAVFRSLQVFAGGFTAEGVQRLHQRLAPAGAEGAEASWQALDALQALVDKSLVQVASAEAGAAPRLSLLDSAREFALLQLDAAGELPRTQRAHAELMADRMDQARAEHERLRDRDWVARHAPERLNVRAALDWACVQDDPELLARLVAALGLIESATQTPSELVSLPLPLDQLRRATPARRAMALLELGWAHHLDGSGEQGEALATEALADFEALGDAAGRYLALIRLIRMAYRRNGQQAQVQARVRALWQRLQAIDPAAVPLRTRLTFESSASYLVDAPRSLARLRELQALAEGAGFDDIVAVCQVNVTDELMVQGRDEEVVAEARAALATGLKLPRRRALACHNLALALLRLGRTAEAREAAMVVWRALPSQAYLVLDLFAFAAARQGRLHDAALVAGCSAAIRRRRDVQPEVCEAALIEDTWQRLRQGLGAARLDDLARVGERLPVDEALARALGT